MVFETFEPDKSVSLFVKKIWVFTNDETGVETSLPFFADGYPGLMFQQTNSGLTVYPHQKLMPVLFLYGQTINPIELRIFGAYTLVVLQLYPFVLKSLFSITPQTVNDNCYDLQQMSNVDIATITEHLNNAKNIKEKLSLLTVLLQQLFDQKKQNLDYKVKQVIENIINSKGQQNINAIAQQLNLHARTLERRFLNETGLSPKKFAQIIQFQSSLEQLTLRSYNRLTDIVYENGFADQSHFIKVFKAFTGKTPKAFSQHSVT